MIKSKIWVKKTRHVQNLAISKKTTILVQSSWNLVKIIASWGNRFHQVSWRLDKNCGFFNNSQYLNVCGFFLLRLYQQKQLIEKITELTFHQNAQNIFSQMKMSPLFWLSAAEEGTKAKIEKFFLALWKNLIAN